MFDPRSRMFPIQRESDEISAFKEVLRALKNLKETFKEFKAEACRPHAPERATVGVKEVCHGSRGF
jgi:hypothetical protein